MGMENRINLGIVGACGRGGSFREALAYLREKVRVRAVCDINVAALPQAAQQLGAEEQYTEYEEMLDRSQLDAVLIGTPMPLHVPQAIAALERNLHVL